MAESTIVKTKRDGTITIKDQSGANSLIMAYEEGNFTLNIPGPAVQLFLDRGEIGSTPSIRFGDEAPMSGSFSGYLRDVYDATYATLFGILTDQPPAGWTPTMGATSEVKTWQVVYTIEGTNHGDSADHTITMNHCRLTGSLTEGYPINLACNFTAYDVFPTTV
jgi:hypothetical protein